MTLEKWNRWITLNWISLCLQLIEQLWIRESAVLQMLSGKLALISFSQALVIQLADVESLEKNFTNLVINFLLSGERESNSKNVWLSQVVSKLGMFSLTKCRSCIYRKNTLSLVDQKMQSYYWNSSPFVRASDTGHRCRVNSKSRCLFLNSRLRISTQSKWKAVKLLSTLLNKYCWGWCSYEKLSKSNLSTLGGKQRAMNDYKINLHALQMRRTWTKDALLKNRGTMKLNN